MRYPCGVEVSPGSSSHVTLYDNEQSAPQGWNGWIYYLVWNSEAGMVAVFLQGSVVLLVE